MEEQQDGNDAESHQREIELLKEESMVPLDQLLSTLNLPQVLAQPADVLVVVYEFKLFFFLMLFTLNVRCLCCMAASFLYDLFFLLYIIFKVYTVYLATNSNLTQ